MRSAALFISSFALGCAATTVEAEPASTPSASVAAASASTSSVPGVATAAEPEALDTCRNAPVAVEVLGSGGPILDAERVSAGYLVWSGGRARVWVDMGPGTALRYTESGAKIDDLQAIALTHLHIDHSADLVAFAKTHSFGRRKAALPVLGPAGREGWPGLQAWSQSLLGRGGAYGYLAAYLGDGRPFRLDTREIATDGAARVVLEDGDLTIRAVGVPHGPVPALGYEVSVGGTRIAFTGDQRADDARFSEMATGVDVLVAHLAVGDSPDSVAGNLHATPQAVGALAKTTRPGTLVLSHLMPRSLADLDRHVATIEAAFDGPVVVAEDHLCVALDDS